MEVVRALLGWSKKSTRRQMSVLSEDRIILDACVVVPENVSTASLYILEPYTRSIAPYIKEMSRIGPFNPLPKT